MKNIRSIIVVLFLGVITGTIAAQDSLKIEYIFSQSKARAALEKAEAEKEKAEKKDSVRRMLDSTCNRPIAEPDFEPVPSIEHLRENIPCAEESKSDSLYIRAMGIGEYRAMQYAMRTAQSNAQRQLITKILSEYNLDYITLENVEMVCNSVQTNSCGMYVVYVAVQVLREEIEKIISNDDNE